MDVLDISRWQFGITTVYHFVFVPLTIGLAPLVAVMQTVWAATGKPGWYRATKFFGKLFLINFALGIVTGIVQEFQFGMNWSEYSRFVGDVFGAPLALEGLAAFFLESTFLGLWIFGWGRLPKAVHLASIWMAAIGVNLSAYFIIAANSFMQHPVGAVYNPETGRAELTSIWALLTNPTALAAVPHTIAGAFLTAGTFVAGIGMWWMVRASRQQVELVAAGDVDAGAEKKTQAREIFRPVTRLALWVMIVSGAALIATGDIQGKLMFDQQPMKMAAAESLCHTETDPKFSVLTVGTHNNCESVSHLIEVPYVLPYLAEGRLSGVELRGVQDLQAHYEEQFGPGNYSPNLFVTYWSFRAMIGLGVGSALLAVVGLWYTRPSAPVPDQRWLGTLGIAAIPFPFLANSAGWVFTEMGRQPWVVHPNPVGDPMISLLVGQGVSDHSPWLVLGSLAGFTIVYGALAVVWFVLIRRYTIEGPLEHDAEPHLGPPDGDDAGRPLSFAY
ncbi:MULTISPECIES: cytochrome ubiquinol oxidase subunit I [unclassified Dietzia]|uniref:cytochrome ubiquinol oxidase subunit I n=1 Tax=unclassified Dietzia TaxID=2617939 RepID=UPI000D20198B|nr:MULTISPECIES: cytochrome ubiquinol oxidase subunit I [unclassified Dietzia]AVZ38719.1 cytochrome ubiquinol oxidase subunit I [Dietzia sp. JS16-p6b]MBB1024342.1 cytochrome ubiquinol oxidase subunit I [Dietzia sp. DQ12-76]MBB1029034.1 cytochrome ubiquinol oxidase subunit I [Dietzia sp. DQ11-38-2]QGW23815.1 cytochrome d ubiquinol oxidase subunit 1 [Dietzia sp. DQ12-45-1b]